MNHSVFFVGGIHGVGKTTFCTNLSKDLGIPSYVASEVINKSTSNKQIKIDKMIDNQELLIAELSLITESTDIILDGHFVLLNHNYDSIRISINTFKGINPKLLFILIDTPEEIYNRLLKRDNTQYSIEILEKMQREEILNAKAISKILNIPLHIIDINKEDYAIHIVRKYRREK